MSLAMRVSRAQYQGDPGIWGFLKGAAKAGIALATSGPLAAATSVQQSLQGRRQPTPRAPVMGPMVYGATTPAGGSPPSRPMLRTFAPNGVPVTPVPGFGGMLARGIPGGQTGFEVLAPSVNGAGGPAGHHLNKSGYFLQSGEYVAPRTKWVRNRRRNPGNIKAASRALSRVVATKKALTTFSKVSVRDDSAPKTKTVYKCMKCRKNPCTC